LSRLAKLTTTKRKATPKQSNHRNKPRLISTLTEARLATPTEDIHKPNQPLPVPQILLADRPRPEKGAHQPTEAACACFAFVAATLAGLSMNL